MRSRAGYLLGGCLIALGVVGAILWLFTSATTIPDEVNGFQRGPVTGETTMQLEAHKYVIYYEGSSAEVAVPPFEIEIAEARTGTPLAIAPYSGSLTYSILGHEGSAQATVTPERPGAYVVRTTSDVRPIGANVALGRSIAGPIVRALLGAVAIGLLLIASGSILLAVTAVRRSRSRRAPTGPTFARRR
jgi:hypothetical protein